MLIFPFLGLLLTASLSAAERQEPRLDPFTAKYELNRGSLKLGKVEIILELDKRGDYRYSARTTPVGLAAILLNGEVKESSSGTIIRAAVIPYSYHYIHRSSDNPRSVELRFDWQSMRVTNSLKAGSWSMKIEQGTQDKFSQQLSLMLAFAAGSRSVSFAVADGGRTKDYSYQFQGEDQVEVAAGRFQTLKVARSKNKRSPNTSLWLAPRLNHLPVIVEKQEKDGPFRMELSSFSWGAPAQLKK